MELSIEVSANEWSGAASLLSMVSGDERTAAGLLMLSSDGVRRRWWFTDSVRLAVVDGEEDDRVYELVVSPRLVAAGVRFAERDVSVRIVLSGDDSSGESIAIESTAGSVLLPFLRPNYPDVPAVLAALDSAPGISARIDADELLNLINTARLSAAHVDQDGPQPVFTVSVADDHVELAVDWDELGIAIYSLGAEAVTGTGSVRADPRLLQSLLSLFSGEISVTIPDQEHDAIRISAPGLAALLMPIRGPLEGLRVGVDETLVTVFGPDVAQRDNDGDYRLSRQGTPVYGRLLDGEPPRLLVFAPVVHELEPTEDLLRELNDYNRSIGFVRIFWVDGSVLAECDLVAETLDPEEVWTAFDRVSGVASELGPVVAAMYGGAIPNDGLTSRWSAYANTELTAEVGPGTELALNGPHAVVEWPFREPVHVLTAHDPQGVGRPPEANRENNAELAADIARLGAGMLRCVGASPDGAHAEPGFLVWGLDRDTARQLGRRYGQDAVFEVDDTAVHIIASYRDRVQSGSRMSLPITVDNVDGS